MAKRLKAQTRLKKLRDTRPRAQMLAGSRAGNYQNKLKVLRSILSGFDAKKLDSLQRSKPKTEKSRTARRAMLAKISRTYARIKPFVHRGFKAVAPPDKENFAELKKYVGINSFKGLRAIPVPTMRAKHLRVRFDKKHRVTIKDEKHVEKFFRFPHAPRSVDDAVEMLEAMLPSMPWGVYIIATRHHFLIPTAADKGQLINELKSFWTNYGDKAPDFVRLVFGFKWIARAGEVALKRLHELKSERGRAKQARSEARAAKVIAAISAMDRHFKGHYAEQKIGAPSRAQRGLPWVEKIPYVEAKKIIDNEKRRKKPPARGGPARGGRLSKRARATGRR